MISERMLKKWRKEAFINIANRMRVTTTPHDDYEVHLNQRILMLTQDLMDQYLLKQKK